MQKKAMNIEMRMLKERKENIKKTKEREQIRWKLRLSLYSIVWSPNGGGSGRDVIIIGEAWTGVIKCLVGVV